MGEFGCMCIERDANALVVGTVCGCCEWEHKHIPECTHSMQYLLYSLTTALVMCHPSKRNSTRAAQSKLLPGQCSTDNRRRTELEMLTS